ncbi:MAG TPA: 50S ribosomal protein L4 [Candidatus Peribacterales bacterium]|nr:50S ribosomal protein L4 [Candidatus Peribacterales bacterium]
MKIDVYSATGSKKSSIELPKALFEAEINNGLMHEAILRQQSNRRKPIAHTKSRSEIVSSTRKLYQQKGTGRARRGSASANLLKGGYKVFGPRNTRNFRKDMPKGMRRAALFSCLSASAKAGRIVGLENYGTDHKTKVFVDLLVKLPVSPGRKIVFVLPKHMEALERGSRNVPGVKTILAQYLNPEDVLGAHSLVFLVEALKVAEDIFTKRLVVSDKPSDSKKKLPAKRSSLAASKTSKISSPDSAS